MSSISAIHYSTFRLSCGMFPYLYCHLFWVMPHPTPINLLAFLTSRANYVRTFLSGRQFISFDESSTAGTDSLGPYRTPQTVPPGLGTRQDPVVLRLVEPHAA